jgi:hypothetical protein
MGELVKSYIALAKALDVLYRKGQIPASSLSARVRRSLVTLFETGVLEEKRQGPGFRIVVLGRVPLNAFIGKKFPSGLDAVLAEGSSPTSRGQSVALFRDAKVARRAIGEPVLMRGFGEAVLHNRGKGSNLELAVWTREAGVAAVNLGQGSCFQFDGIVVIVENLESFLLVEKVIPDIDCAIYSGGRMSSRLLDWLAEVHMSGCLYIHFGDYDPVGIDEYLKLLGRCPGRVSLFVPEDLEKLFEKYAKKELLEKSEAVLQRLRGTSDAQAQLVVGLMDRFGGGVEQEVVS